MVMLVILNLVPVLMLQLQLMVNGGVRKMAMRLLISLHMQVDQLQEMNQMMHIWYSKVILLILMLLMAQRFVVEIMK